jgi:PAS domain S-box-containing protein
MNINSPLIGTLLQKLSSNEGDVGALRSLFWEMVDLVFILDAAGDVCYCSSSCFPVLGYSTEELEHKPFRQFIHHEQQSSFDKIFSSIRIDKPIVDLLQVKTKGGFYLHMNSYTILIDEQAHLYLTALKKAKEDMVGLSDAFVQKLESNLSNSFGDDFFEILAIFFCKELQVDFAFIAEIVSFEPLGWNTRCFCNKGQLFAQFLYNPEGSPFSAILERKVCCLEKNVSSLFPGDEFITENKIESLVGILAPGSDGKPVGFFVLMNTTPFGKLEMIKRIIRMFSNRIGIEIERLRMDKRIMEAMLRAEEQERMKFAANLHDEVGPILSGLNIYLSSLIESEEGTKNMYVFGKMQELINSAIGTVREVCNDIVPQSLLNLGLEKALLSYLDSFQGVIHISFICQLSNAKLDSSVEIALFRIIKELVNNTLKHAQASCIEIRLFKDKNNLTLIYSDNGKGFEYDKKINGFGFVSIFNRALSINAQPRIISRPGEGFLFELNAGLVNHLVNHS